MKEKIDMKVLKILILREMQILEPGKKIEKMDIKILHFTGKNKNEIKATWIYKNTQYSAINLGLFNQSINISPIN